MVELAILSGRRASTVVCIDQFPCTLGRSTSGVELDDAGVAPQHATLILDRESGFQIEALGEATIYSGGQSVRQLRLHNGELFELGGLRLQFRLRPARPRNLAWLENLSAAAVAACFMAEGVWIFLSPAWP